MSAYAPSQVPDRWCDEKTQLTFWFRLRRGDSLDVSIRLNTSRRWKAEVVLNGGSSDNCQSLSQELAVLIEQQHRRQWKLGAGGRGELFNLLLQSLMVGFPEST